MQVRQRAEVWPLSARHGGVVEPWVQFPAGMHWGLWSGVRARSATETGCFQVPPLARNALQVGSVVTRKMETASGIMERTVAAPCTSMRSTTSVLFASASTTWRARAPGVRLGRAWAVHVHGP